LSRVALVTGAGQGIGRAIAMGLSEAGLAVAAVGRTLAKLEDTVARLPGVGIAVSADLTDPDQVRAAFQATAERLGGLDVLVNCAADYGPFRIDEASDARIVDMVAQSLTSAIFCTRDAVNLMRRRGGGDIVHISSQSAELPQPFMTVYGACKAGVETLCQGLRYELKGEDFRVIVCQIGVIAETVPKPGSGYAENRERIWDSWRKTGIAGMYAYPGSPADGVAAAVVHAVTAPREVQIHTISLRGAEAPASPAGAGEEAATP
jgi:NAD(P)-dependent dehydrogenase (short-subunit alcohol dehydrogenase family)